MEINTQAITNCLDNINKFCIDWNHLGCIAYATSNSIHIIDSTNMKVIKTLHSPRGSSICKLKWSIVNLNSNFNTNPILASASDDIISIWDVNEPKITHELFPNDGNNQSNPNNKVIDMKWITNAPSLTKNNNSNTLIALYSNSKLTIWNAQNSTRLWSKTFTDQKLNSFAIDPHDFLKLAFLGSNFIYFLRLEILNDSSFVEKYQRKFYLASNDSTNPSESESSTDSKRSSTVNLLTNYWKNMKQNESKSNQTSQQRLLLKECFQIEFHSYVKNLIFLVYPREIFIFDLAVNQTIGFVQADKILSQFQQIYTCSQADGFYLLHENGSVSVYSRYEDTLFQYNLIAHCDQKRLPKNSNVFGLSVCPNTERFSTVLLSDGRVLKYELFEKRRLKNQNDHESLFLFEFIKKSNLKLMLTSLLDSNSSSSFVIKIGPRLTKKNCKYWQPLLAIGDSSGFLSIFNLNKSQLVKKITTTTYSIAGIEWMNMNSVITWSYSNSSVGLESPGAQNKQILVKNEILYTDLRTGESVNIRLGHVEESPVTNIKISYLRQYMVILFKENPLEIWDLKNFALIKKISRKSPIISILEWCPHDFNKKLETKPVQESKNTDSTVNIDEAAKGDLKETQVSELKESFICIDTTGLMYSFSVECNHIKDGSILLPEDGYLVNITCFDLKKDLIIFGDSSGNLSTWNIRTKTLKNSTVKTRSELKKIKFAPGKENMLLLVQLNDMLKIFDSNNFEAYSQFNSKVKILDSYWCSSDTILVYFVDLTMRIYDINFKQTYDFGQIMAPNLFKLNERENNLFKLKSCLFERVFKNETEETDEKFSDSLKVLFSKKLGVDYKSRVEQYAALSLFINSNGFETKFWCLFSYLMDEIENSKGRKFRSILNYNSIFLNSKEFRSNEIELLSYYKEKLEFNQQLGSVLKDLLLSNQLDSAFNYLMDTDSTSDGYTNNLIKACLISSLMNSNENSQTKTSIKLVATNLIANGKIYDGVELLSLIGLVFDACRYLQDNNEWEKAAWLAKIRLGDEEQNEVIKRWCENLCMPQVNRKEIAILLLLSCKAYWKVLDLLADTNYIQLTYLLIEYLISNSLISLGENFKVDKTVNFADHVLSQVDSITNQQHQNTVKKIINNYLDFKKLLNL